MPDLIDNNGNWSYVRSGYRLSDTHGAGHSELHLREIEEIANKVVDEKINQVIRTLETAIPQAINEYGLQVWDKLINGLDSVLKADIYSKVKVGLNGAKDVFYGEKCQEYITNSIYTQLKDELSKLKGISIK